MNVTGKATTILLYLLLSQMLLDFWLLREKFESLFNFSSLLSTMISNSIYFIGHQTWMNCIATISKHFLQKQSKTSLSEIESFVSESIFYRQNLSRGVTCAYVGYRIERLILCVTCILLFWQFLKTCFYFNKRNDPILVWSKFYDAAMSTLWLIILIKHSADVYEKPLEVTRKVALQLLHSKCIFFLYLVQVKASFQIFPPSTLQAINLNDTC